jgi:hypothetical protein
MFTVECGTASRALGTGWLHSVRRQVDVQKITADFEEAVLEATKRSFFSHLYIKMIILPRQARDKHRESTQKKDRFVAACVELLRHAGL